MDEPAPGVCRITLHHQNMLRFAAKKSAPVTKGKVNALRAHLASEIELMAQFLRTAVYP
jgi:hypothetical protein